jgi:Polyketide cyclase / dehydrase and lipid transport
LSAKKQCGTFLLVFIPLVFCLGLTTLGVIAMLKIILYVLCLAIVLLLLYAATRPDSFRIERTILIKASADKIFPFFNNFHHWPQWSPYEGLDPRMKRSYSGANEGVGAAYDWSGDAKTVGQGRMEIVASERPYQVLMNLEFVRPFEAHNMAEFNLQPKGQATEVTWAMFGEQSFSARLMGLFFSMEKMVGPQFEQGLQNLKAVAEKSAE